MAKVETSNVRKKSKKKLPERKRTLLKNDSARFFISVKKEDLAAALTDCLMTGDLSSFKEILRAYLSSKNKSEITKKTKLSRKTIYNLLSDDGNPTLENLAKILSVA